MSRASHKQQTFFINNTITLFSLCSQIRLKNINGCFYTNTPDFYPKHTRINFIFVKGFPRIMSANFSYKKDLQKYRVNHLFTV